MSLAQRDNEKKGKQREVKERGKGKYRKNDVFLTFIFGKSTSAEGNNNYN